MKRAILSLLLCLPACSSTTDFERLQSAAGTFCLIARGSVDQLRLGGVIDDAEHRRLDATIVAACAALTNALAAIRVATQGLPPEGGQP